MVPFVRVVTDLRAWVAAVPPWQPLPLGMVAGVAVFAVLYKQRFFSACAFGALAGFGWTHSAIAGVGTTSLACGLAAGTSPGDLRRTRTVMAAALPWTLVLIARDWAAPGTLSRLSDNLLERSQTYLPTVLTFTVLGAAVLLVLAGGARGFGHAWHRVFRPAMDPRRTFSEAQRVEILARFGNKCAYCGVPGDALGVQLAMDHIVPWSKGGRTEVSNGQPLCPPCNSAKGDLSDEEARRKLGVNGGFLRFFRLGGALR